MTETLADRLRHRMKELGLKALPVAETAGVGRSFVYDILRGKSAEPSGEKLSKIATVLKVPVEYLLHGGDSDGDHPAGDRSDHDYVAVPFIMVEADMGGGAIVDDEVAGDPWHFARRWLYETLRLQPSALKLIRVRGDSMEPTLLSGDVVMIDTSRTSPRPTGIFVLHDGFGLVAKRLERVPNSDPATVKVISDNTRYSPYERPAEEIRIIGRIVWFARHLADN